MEQHLSFVLYKDLVSGSVRSVGWEMLCVSVMGWTNQLTYGSGRMAGNGEHGARSTQAPRRRTKSAGQFPNTCITGVGCNDNTCSRIAAILSRCASVFTGNRFEFFGMASDEHCRPTRSAKQICKLNNNDLKYFTPSNAAIPRLSGHH